MRTRTIALPILSAIGLLGLAAPATAQEPDIVVTAPSNLPPGTDPVSKVVAIADLDLSSEQGEAEMKKRVEAAIKQICWSHPKPARWQVKDSEECDAFAREGVQPQMDAALARAKDS